VGSEKLSGEREARRIIARSRLHIPFSVRGSFLLFVLSIPYEPIGVGVAGAFSLTRISGLVFFVSYLFHYGSLSHRSFFASIPRALLGFMGYLAVYTLNGLAIPEISTQPFVTQLVTLVQLVVLFWIGSSLLQEGKMARSVLVSYAIASAVLAVGILVELPGFSSPTQVISHDGRETGLGYNPNSLGTVMALAALIPIGLFFNPSIDRFTHWLLFSSLFPLLAMLVKTGSRAGIGAFIIGCAVYLLPFVRQKHRIFAIIFAVFGISAVVFMIARNPELVERWEMVSEGKLASRENIYPTAVEMILERPIFGWQPVEFTHELGSRLNVPSGRRDAHNLFLHLFLEVGLAGAIPFFIGLSLCAWAAWRARAGELRLLPLALVLAILAANFTHTFLFDKAHWTIFAMAVASATSVARRQRSRFSLPSKILHPNARSSRVVSEQ
jgi:O-antigen ligase